MNKSIFNSVDKTKLSLPGIISNTSEATTWSYEIYKNSYLNKLQKFKQPTLTEALQHGKVIIDFLMGNLENADSLEASIKVVLCSMTISQRELCPKSVIGVEVVPTAAKTDRSKWNYEFVKSAATSDAGQRFVTTNNIKEAITIESAIKWGEELMTALSDQGNEPKERQGRPLVNYIGFYCLNLMRLSVKTADQVEKHICEFFEDRVIKFWQRKPIAAHVHPPASSSYNDLCGLMGRQTISFDQLLTLVVEMYHAGEESNNSSITGVLKAGCVLSLSTVGLGILNWLHQASTVSGLSMSDFLDYLDNTVFQPTLRKVVMMMVSLNNNKDYSWPFARLFQDTALSDFATKNDALLCCFCIYLAREKDDAIWTAAQYASISSVAKKNGRLMAEAFKEIRSNVTEAQCASENAKQLVRLTNLKKEQKSIFHSHNNSEDVEEDSSDEEEKEETTSGGFDFE